MVLVLVITAALTVAGCLTLTVIARSYVAKPGPAAVVDDAQIRPALVHYVIANCRPGIAAYEATILDLAARGFMSVSAHPTGLWLAYTEAGARAAGTTPLAGYEQSVLDSMHGRLKNTGGAPLAALAEACRVDVQGTWKPFDERLSTEARKRGLCRRRLPLTAAWSTVAGLTTVAAGTFAGVLVSSRPHASVGGTIVAALITWLVFTCVLALGSYNERLTALGATLAARWTQEQAALATSPATWTEASLDALQRRAFAVALSVPGAGLGPPGRAGRVVAERPSDSRMPSQAWSSFTGSWRLVKIKKTAKAGMSGAVHALVAGVIAGAFDFLFVTLIGFRSWELPLTAVAASLAVIGAVNVVRISAIPIRLTFDAQVIARWVVSNGSDGTTEYFAVDDGEKAWVFTGDVALEDVLRITVNPRNAQLIDFAVVAHQRPETTVEVSQPRTPQPRRAEPLLSTVEVAEFIGPVSRTTAIPSLGGYGTIYRGRDGTLSLTVATGGIANFNTMISRNAGTPLPEVGDAAWVLNKDRTVIVRVGEQVAKITASGHGLERRPDLLAIAARTVAARLSEQAGSAGGAQAATWPGAESPASPA